MNLRIAVIAHDGKKSDMVSFILNNQAFLKEASLFATGTTGSKIEEEGFKVIKLFLLSVPCKFNNKIPKYRSCKTTL